MAKAVDSTPIVLQICTPLQVVAPFIILVVFYRIICYNKTIPKEGVDSMRYIISGKNIDITPGLKEAAENKIGKLERYFSPDTEVQVTMSVEKGRQKIEVTIPVKGSIIRAEQDSNDMYVSIDLVEEIIERQIKKYKTKLIDKKQSALSCRRSRSMRRP